MAWYCESENTEKVESDFLSALRNKLQPAGKVIFMIEERRIPSSDVQQNLILESREILKISGVNDVSCFNENLVEAETVLGKLIVRGEGVRIARLDLNEKVLEISGYIYSCEYEDKSKSMRKGLFGGMFG
ncbi:MAG: sporulation protein YabP [Clostridia bacterium]|nr:sporulation protein YabP [Clostridia bacterium]